MVDIKDIPINQMILKKAIGGDELESYNINLRNEGGGRALELKITCADGTRRVVVLTDRGFCVDTREVKLHPFYGKDERNAEIYRLYKDEHLTQVFLADLFSITQPSVSLIIKDMKSK